MLDSVSWTSLRRLRPSVSHAVVRRSKEEDQDLIWEISWLMWEIKGCDLHGRLMDLVWWETRGFDGGGGRTVGLFGKESDRRKTPTMFRRRREREKEKERWLWMCFEMVREEEGAFCLYIHMWKRVKCGVWDDVHVGELATFFLKNNCFCYFPNCIFSSINSVKNLKIISNQRSSWKNDSRMDHR